MLWGGRFKEQLDKTALNFSSSINFDINLLIEDLQVSKAHAKMLANAGLISLEESKVIVIGLNSIEQEWNEDRWNPLEGNYEDIHSAIEARLTEKIGAVAGKLHTGRSRNDQVATSMRLWIKKVCIDLNAKTTELQKSFLSLAENHLNTIIPGYTHLQRAQPISFAFHLLAYVEMLERDKQRLDFVFQQSDFSPLGCGALAGSTLPLDRNFTSEELGFQKPTANALDTVSDRDFLLDFLNCCSVGMMHLSRLSEEIILWSSSEWKLIRLSDKFTTGSSLMPQKKNPDMAELIRGKSGRVFGNYFSLVTTMKGLPLSYNRDLQEDKEPVFDSYQAYSDSLQIMSAMISSLEVNSERFTNELKKDFSLATDLADWLVLKGIPFREAHHIVGNLVKYSEEKNINFDQVNLEDLKEIHSVFDETALECLNIETSLKRKKTYGSPNPEMIKKQIENWYKILL